MLYSVHIYIVYNTSLHICIQYSTIIQIGHSSDHPYTPSQHSYMLEVNTMNESVVMPKIAGTLSNANNTSLSSTHTKHRNKGVARRLPFSIVKKLHRVGAYMCIIRVSV